MVTATSSSNHSVSRGVGVATEDHPVGHSCQDSAGTPCSCIVCHIYPRFRYTGSIGMASSGRSTVSCQVCPTGQPSTRWSLLRSSQNLNDLLNRRQCRGPSAFLPAWYSVSQRPEPPCGLSRHPHNAVHPGPFSIRQPPAPSAMFAGPTNILKCVMRSVLHRESHSSMKSPVSPSPAISNRRKCQSVFVSVRC